MKESLTLSIPLESKQLSIQNLDEKLIFLVLQIPKVQKIIQIESCEIPFRDKL